MAKMEDVFSISLFDPAKFADLFHDFAEKGSQQSREAYAKMKVAGEEVGKTFESHRPDGPGRCRRDRPSGHWRAAHQR